MEKVYILLDVGGTEIKCSISDEKGTIIHNVCSYESCANKGNEEVLDNFTLILKEWVQKVQEVLIAGIGFAFPGPFDYEHGISLMKGINKYDSIYGVSIEREMKKRLPALREVPFKFLHDVEAFALGVCSFGQAVDARRVFCLCIGTGAGSAFLENGIPLKEERQGVPKNGWIYCVPYKESIVDDYISVRGLETISKQVMGAFSSGKELAKLCRLGNQKAQIVWERFGEELKDSMTPFLDSFCPDTVVIGGQIAKSFDLFGEGFQKECEKRGIKLYIEPETSVKTMQGLFVSSMKEKEEC